MSGGDARPPVIGHISDTARWVAVYRAMESERPDAIFKDPFARRLAGEQGQAIVDQLKHGRQMAWAMIVRTAVFDEIILDLISRGEIDLVLDLAAGLDTRPWRLPLPSTFRWVDVDLPAQLEYKAEAMRGEKPNCIYQAIPADLARPTSRAALFSQLKADGARALVLTEGLIIYLTEQQVRSLATDLHAQAFARWWLTDLASPRLLRMIRKSTAKTFEQSNASFQFGPAEGPDFFLPLGWKPVVFRSSMEEARRLRREMPYMWIWRIVGSLSSAKRREEFRRMSGYLLMERD
jgi:methyltransferase (TIGR00027 family)